MENNNFENRRKGMVLFRAWLYPQELESLFSDNSEVVKKTLETIRERGDIVKE